MKKIVTVAALIAVLLVPSLFGLFNEVNAQVPPYEYILYENTLMIPMRDEVKLGTDIYRPAIRVDGVLVPAEGPFPIVMQRTPYDKSAGSYRNDARYYATQGYVSVVQDLRGCYTSEGVFEKYMDSVEDGYDTVMWLGKNLPYAIPKVGMYGTSYGAHTQADAAKLAPEYLKTLILNCGGVYNPWEYKVLFMGVMEWAQQVAWALNQAKNETNDPVLKDILSKVKIWEWAAVEDLPLKRGLSPLALVPEFENYIFNMMTGTDYNDYWSHRDWNWSVSFDTTADIPMMHATGWYDSYTSGSIKNYLALKSLKDSKMSLLVGPWVHGGNTRSYAGDVEFGPAGAITDWGRAWHVRWFDYHLKGVENGVGNLPEAKIFVMGTGDGHKDANGRMFHGGFWVNAAEWPLPGTVFTNYYFHQDGSLSPEPPQKIKGKKVDWMEKTTYQYDPLKPVPTIGGSFSPQGPLVYSGAYDQREKEWQITETGGYIGGYFGSEAPYLPLSARNDVLVFQTEPLEQDMMIAGPIKVKLFIESSAVSTDFTAKLIDVYPGNTDYPEGFAMNITDGIARTDYRESREYRVMMKPQGKHVYEIEIEPFPTANIFKAGHRIRIDISSSNFPRFEPNPNSGEPIGLYKTRVIANNSVYHSNKFPSHVILPIAPIEQYR